VRKGRLGGSEMERLEGRGKGRVRGSKEGGSEEGETGTGSENWKGKRERKRGKWKRGIPSKFCSLEIPSLEIHLSIFPFPFLLP